MTQASGWRSGLIAAAASACAALVLAADLASKGREPAAPPPKGREEADGIRVISPPDRAVLASGEFDIICKATAADTTLEVDGDTPGWEPFQPPLKVARASLYAGLNRLRIGKRQLEVFVAKTAEQPGGPEGWPLYRFHPPDSKSPQRCAGCHETEKPAGQIRVGALKPYKACFECHKAVEFEAIHTHPLEPLQPCQMCHAPHGAPYQKLLKAPVKKLCAECHDS